MDQRSKYLIQILDKIGAPLMGALTGAQGKDQAEETEISQTAQNMAGLLSRTVQVSIDIGKSMDLGVDAEQADAIRVALAGLASPIIADQYKNSARLPDDNDLKQIVTALEAVLTFSDNFVPTAENVERMQNLQPDGTAVDPNQSIVQFINAMTPAITAVTTFSFGQQENKIIREVTDRLTKKATELRENIWSDDLPAEQQKPIELALIRALAILYADSHRAETEKLANSDGAPPSLDPVWKTFDTQTAMLEAVANSILPGSAAKESASKAPPAPAQPEPPAQQAEEQKQTPPPAAPTETPPPAAEPPAAAPEPTEQPAQNNPMASFVKKPTEGSEPSTPPAAPPEQPPAAPQEPLEKTPAAEDNQDENEAQDNPPGNPMSFFKTPGGDDKSKDNGGNQE